jgi:septum site-determining protein MinD
MGTSIVVTSGKGGVGKTTTTANIGTALAMEGNKVCLVDADTGLRNLDLHLGLENRIVYNLVDVVEGTCRLKQALIKDKRYENLFLLPTAQTKDKTAVTPEQMLELIDSLKNDFDFIIIDCPAGIEHGFENAVAGADKAIVVTTPEVSAVRDADRIIGMLESAQFKDIKLVVNRIRAEMVKNGNMLSVEDLLEHLCINLLGVIPEDKDVIISTNKGEPMVISNEHSLASMAFNNIALRLTGENVPLVPIQEDSFWTRLKRNLFFKQTS